MRDVDVAPYATLIAACTPLLIAVGAGAWKVWEKFGRKKPAAVVPEPVPLPEPTAREVAYGDLVTELRRQINRLVKERRVEEVEKDWWRDAYRDHVAREHQDRTPPEYPKETP